MFRNRRKSIPENEKHWLTQVGYSKFYDKYRHLSEKNFKSQYPEISKHVQNASDLEKIIFEDEIIVAQGQRCSIVDWKKLVSDRLEAIKEHIKERRFPEQIWLVMRYKMDVYALLRMFRRPGSDTRKQRFQNVIYHAGDWHARNISILLQRLGYTVDMRRAKSNERAHGPGDDGKFHVVDPERKADSLCLALDMKTEITFDDEHRN